MISETPFNDIIDLLNMTKESKERIKRSGTMAYEYADTRVFCACTNSGFHRGDLQKIFATVL